MENHTKRIRKSRRQGLGDNGKALARSPRVRMTARDTAADIPGTPRAGARRSELTTGRKTKRQKPTAARRRTAQTRTRR